MVHCLVAMEKSNQSINWSFIHQLLFVAMSGSGTPVGRSSNRRCPLLTGQNHSLLMSCCELGAPRNRLLLVEYEGTVGPRTWSANVRSMLRRHLQSPCRKSARKHTRIVQSHKVIGLTTHCQLSTHARTLHYLARIMCRGRREKIIERLFKVMEKDLFCTYVKLILLAALLSIKRGFN